MKKATVAIVIGLFLATTVMAQSLPTTHIKEIGFLGKGLAISESDPKDVHEVKMGVATVTVNITNQTTDVKAGVLYFDNVKYKLKTLSVENKTASGDIYLNDTNVGSFQITLTSKSKLDLWSGTIILNQVTYNLYMLEGVRTIKAAEVGDKVSDYCQEHHEELNCSSKIKDYCQNNPQDSRCQALLRNFCRNNLQDEQCRQTLKDWCVNHTNAELCKDYCKDNPTVCSVSVQRCSSCPSGYRPTSDGFCAPNCRMGRRNCAQNIINCPTATTTTNSTSEINITRLPTTGEHEGNHSQSEENTTNSTGDENG
jgi:hypothetical protein